MTRIQRSTAFSVASVAALLALAKNDLPQQKLNQNPDQRASYVRFTTGHNAVIPFEFADDAIVIRASVNDSKPMKFFFDTGAGMSVLSSRQAASLPLNKPDTVRAVGTGGTVEGSLATGVTLSLAGVKVRNQSLAVISLDGFPCEAQDIAGVIGYDFIKEFVVEIDYEARVIKLFEPARYQYSRKGEMLPLTITRTPRVRAKIKLPGQEPIEGLFEIDTGSEGSLVVNSPFVKRHHLLDSLRNLIPTNGRGVGGLSRRADARVDSLQLGSFRIKSPIVEFSLETEGALAAADNDGPIGNEIMRRFKVTLDYSRRQMWLEPNKELSAPFESDMSGIEFEAGGKLCRAFRVTDIVEKSPAAEAGILAGDEIVAIDGRAAEQFTSAQIEEMLMQDGAERSLTLRREGQARVVKIKLRRLI